MVVGGRTPDPTPEGDDLMAAQSDTAAQAGNAATYELPKIVSVIDALGVPMYAVLGAELALSRGLPTPAVILIAAISGVGGGLMRDLLAGDIPELLRPGQYNTLLVLAAAAFYLALRRTGALPDLLRPWAAILVFFAARLLTIRYNWRTRPLQDFQMRRFVAGVTGWWPGRREP